MAKTITAKDVESLGPGRHRAAEKLYLTVSKAGARSWVFLYAWNGKSREAGLGKAGNGGVRLKEARRRAEEGRGMLRQKPPTDPLTVWRLSARSPTFREAVEGPSRPKRGSMEKRQAPRPMAHDIARRRGAQLLQENSRSTLRADHNARRARRPRADLGPRA